MWPFKKKKKFGCSSYDPNGVPQWIQDEVRQSEIRAKAKKKLMDRISQEEADRIYKLAGHHAYKFIFEFLGNNINLPCDYHTFVEGVATRMKFHRVARLHDEQISDAPFAYDVFLQDLKKKLEQKNKEGIF